MIRVFVLCRFYRINVCASLNEVWMLQEDQEVTRFAAVKSTMLHRVLRRKTLIGISVSSVVILSLLLLALRRSDDVYAGQSVIGGDEGPQSEDASYRRSSFLVDTPGCKIPNIDPFDSSILHLVSADNVSVLCNATPPMTYEQLHCRAVSVLTY